LEICDVVDSLPETCGMFVFGGKADIEI
jgi:hypothetical protein